MRNIKCFNSRNVPYSLENVCFKSGSAIELKDALENAKSEKEFELAAREVTKLDWKVDRITDKSIRIKWVDRLGNETFISGLLSEGIISEDKIKKAEQCLIDNGIEKDEVEIVLQALGYILLNQELYPED